MRRKNVAHNCTLGVFPALAQAQKDSGSTCNWKGGIALEAGTVLKMQGICMTFPGVKALENVDFTLKKGEIRALMGENGAGKSTLIKCLTGVNKFEA